MTAVTHRARKLLNLHVARCGVQIRQVLYVQRIGLFVEPPHVSGKNGTVGRPAPYSAAASATLSAGLRLNREARPVQPKAPPEETE
jgi:hypothetical protein